MPNLSRPTETESHRKIWTDADAAPRDAKEIGFRAAKRLAVAAVLVANQQLYEPPGNPSVTAENVRERLSIRDSMDELRAAGVDTGGPTPYGRREKQAFPAGLDRVLTRILRSG